MLLVLASRHDAAAADLVRRWRRGGATGPAHDVRLVTCQDLSRPGWNWRLDAPETGTIAVGDDVVPVRDVEAVVTLLPGVHPSELVHIAGDERDYVASEMMAFLVGWLTALPARVLNPPTPLCLTGPRLHPEPWHWYAARAGFRVAPVLREVSAYVPGAPGAPAAPVVAAPETQPLVVVAGRCLSDSELAPAAERLARTVHAGLLTVVLQRDADGWLFAGADATVDVTRPATADALLAALGALTPLRSAS